MRTRLPILAFAAMLSLCAAADSSADATPSPGDVEGMYAQARTMLEDRTIQNVSAVPDMLETCARAGYEPAKLLLMDVYEGKRKGIDTKPAKAFALAHGMAQENLPPNATSEEVEARKEAMYRCALYYERGFGCQASPAEAYQWMRHAAAAGLRKAQAELARYLINGVGHSPAPQEALRILRQVAAKAPDTPHIFFYLGYMCMNGIGMHRPNRLMARRFFEFGARMKDARAINNLASMYELGIGVSKDARMALRLYKQAAALGSRDASANMQRLAYKTDLVYKMSTTWQQRIGHAGLRVVQALPISPVIRQWLEEPFLRLSAGS